jgi:serine acetyltransferase
MLKTYIKSDLARLDHPSFRNFFRYYFFPQGTTFRYQTWFRLMQFVKNSRLLKYTVGPVVYLMFRHYEYKYGIHLNSNTPVGKGLCIVHGNGVYLNCRSIGDNFTCYQNVTLGKSRGGGIPSIGNNVTVFTGSVVVGNIMLNDSCTIGALSFVDKDVDQEALVARN